MRMCVGVFVGEEKKKQAPKSQPDGLWKRRGKLEQKHRRPTLIMLIMLASMPPGTGPSQMGEHQDSSSHQRHMCTTARESKCKESKQL